MLIAIKSAAKHLDITSSLGHPKVGLYNNTLSPSFPPTFQPITPDFEFNCAQLLAILYLFILPAQPQHYTIHISWQYRGVLDMYWGCLKDVLALSWAGLGVLLRVLQGCWLRVAGLLLGCWIDNIGCYRVEFQIIHHRSINHTLYIYHTSQITSHMDLVMSCFMLHIICQVSCCMLYVRWYVMSHCMSCVIKYVLTAMHCWHFPPSCCLLTTQWWDFS